MSGIKADLWSSNGSKEFKHNETYSRNVKISPYCGLGGKSCQITGSISKETSTLRHKRSVSDSFASKSVVSSNQNHEVAQNVPSSCRDHRPLHHRRHHSETMSRHNRNASNHERSASSQPSQKYTFEMMLRSCKPLAWSPHSRKYFQYNVRALEENGVDLDLWYRGGLYVYLRSAQFERRPFFRLPTHIFAESSVLQHLDQPKQKRSTDKSAAIRSKKPTANTNDAGKVSEEASSLARAGGIRNALHLPLRNILPDKQMLNFGHDDIEMVFLYRNFFSFLLKGDLVLTTRQHTIQNALLIISDMLYSLGYLQKSTQTFGSIVNTGFQVYCNGLRLRDVRSGPHRIIEALALAEAFRAWELYKEAFVHAVGNFAAMQSVTNPSKSMISPTTMDRIEKANLKLRTRRTTVQTRLNKFLFPSVVEDLANTERNVPTGVTPHKAWIAAFGAFRRFTVSYYRQKYGAWPPKQGRDNTTTEKYAFTRATLRDLYHDFSELYDILAKNHKVDCFPDQSNPDTNKIEATLRQIQRRFDCSAPPVIPSIPFDVPNIPTRCDCCSCSPAEHTPNIPEGEIGATEREHILLGSYNSEYIRCSPWIESFMVFQQRQRSTNMYTLINERCGQWLFIYAVLQTLCLLVIDVSGLQYTNQVEYFLCMSPEKLAPWDSTLFDSVDIDHTEYFHQSHCWERAQQWLKKCRSRHGKDFQAADFSSSMRLEPGLQQSSTMKQCRCINPSYYRKRFRNSHISSHEHDVRQRVTSTNAVCASSKDRSMAFISRRKASLPNPHITFDTILSG